MNHEALRTALIREWWNEYLFALQCGKHDMTVLNLRTDKCVQAGIIKPGTSMPKDGAEDLAASVDDWKKRNKMF